MWVFNLQDDFRNLYSVLKPNSYVDSTLRMDRKHDNFPCLDGSLCKANTKGIWNH